ncbi:MAG: VVA0879 family protein, partial [Candidatus Bipolaricaulota bacterium]
RQRMTVSEWRALGRRLFGDDEDRWRFECPVCGFVATPADWRAAGATGGEVAFSCIGRHVEGSAEAFVDRGKGPCTYAGGGLFRLNPVEVVDEKGGIHEVFAFSTKEEPR